MVKNKWKKLKKKMPEKKTKCRAGMALEKRFLGFDRYSYPVALNVSGKTSIPSYPRRSYISNANSKNSPQSIIPKLHSRKFLPHGHLKFPLNAPVIKC